MLANKHASQVLQDAGILASGFFYDKDFVLIESLADEEVRNQAGTKESKAGLRSSDVTGFWPRIPAGIGNPRRGTVGGWRFRSRLEFFFFATWAARMTNTATRMFPTTMQKSGCRSCPLLLAIFPLEFPRHCVVALSPFEHARLNP